MRRPALGSYLRWEEGEWLNLSSKSFKMPDKPSYWFSESAGMDQNVPGGRTHSTLTTSSKWIDCRELERSEMKRVGATRAKAIRQHCNLVLSALKFCHSFFTSLLLRSFHCTRQWAIVLWCFRTHLHQSDQMLKVDQTYRSTGATTSWLSSW